MVVRMLSEDHPGPYLGLWETGIGLRFVLQLDLSRGRWNTVRE